MSEPAAIDEPTGELVEVPIPGVDEPVEPAPVQQQEEPQPGA